MKREELKALLGDKADDAVIDKIMAMNGQDIEKHKNDATKAADDLKAANDQLKAANEQINAFKEMNPEELKKAADDWKAKYDQAVEQHTAEAKQRLFDTALEKGLAEAKAKYQNEVRSHLNIEELKDKDGNFIAERFTEKIGKIKTDHADLFEAEEGEEPP